MLTLSATHRHRRPATAPPGSWPHSTTLPGAMRSASAAARVVRVMVTSWGYGHYWVEPRAPGIGPRRAESLLIRVMVRPLARPCSPGQLRQFKYGRPAVCQERVDIGG